MLRIYSFYLMVEEFRWIIFTSLGIFELTVSKTSILNFANNLVIMVSKKFPIDFSSIDNTSF